MSLGGLLTYMFVFTLIVLYGLVDVLKRLRHALSDGAQ